MTISKKLVTAAKPHRCDMCSKPIAKGEKHWRCFGAADAGDKPYAIRLHDAPDCRGTA